MSKNQATAGVAISPRASAVVSLAGVTDQSALSFGPVMCVAGEADGQGAQMRTCEGFADQTAEPKATDVIAGSGAHGAQLLRNHPAAWTRVLEYLDSAL